VVRIHLQKLIIFAEPLKVVSIPDYVSLEEVKIGHCKFAITIDVTEQHLIVASTGDVAATRKVS